MPHISTYLFSCFEDFALKSDVNLLMFFCLFSLRTDRSQGHQERKRT